ncbi:MAG TPA: asparagine synthase (glutamine-hydrolyzing) [Longimicrobiales bacterium]|nr:asparagine synthase (glutamine-hydrolyzing) [Longimicrobiales bacterium]
MCGIAGIAALDPRRPLDPAPVHAMLDRLRHRGPDDSGVHVGDGVVLGHRRLSIIDLSGGHQPLFGQRSSTAVVANGEVYNYRELARELEAKGHVFRTASDTEVAAHAYDEWGLDALDRLDAMLALALWDGERRRLVLARDRMGEKPLFWTVADGLLLFASELTALLAHPAVRAELDPRALSAYLALEYVPAPLCMVAGVHKLEPGTSLVLEDGEVAVRPYWRLPAWAPTRLSYAEAVERLRQLLDQAVASRLVSDVPLGVFLSGGIDSSTVAAFAARHGAVETFSIGFEEASFDERVYAREVAARLGTNHHERVLRGADMPALVPRLAELLDEPLGDASIVPTALLSGFARERITVALGGDAGDELFAGYPMHQAQRVAPYARVLGAGGGLLRRAAERLPVSHANFALGFKVRTFLRGLEAPAPLNQGLWLSAFAPAEQRALLAPELWEAAERGAWAFRALEDGWAAGEGMPRVARAARLDALTYLPNDILTKVDRASMSVALEVRAPFLARAVVEFAASLPDAYLMKGLTGKRILRDAVRELLPASVLERPKKGFGIPVAAWLAGPLRELAHDLLGEASLRRAGLFRPEAVSRLLREHEARRADHRKPLWTLLVLELWRRANLGAAVPRPAAPLAGVP